MATQHTSAGESCCWLQVWAAVSQPPQGPLGLEPLLATRQSLPSQSGWQQCSWRRWLPCPPGLCWALVDGSELDGFVTLSIMTLYNCFWVSVLLLEGRKVIKIERMGWFGDTWHYTAGFDLSLCCSSFPFLSVWFMLRYIMVWYDSMI